MVTLREKSRPFDASNCSTLEFALFGAQNCIKFLVFNACSIQNKYQDISNLLEQLDSETIALVTETWMDERRTKFLYKPQRWTQFYAEKLVTPNKSS